MTVRQHTLKYKKLIEIRGRSDIIYLIALGVGGATEIGTFIGYLFQNISHKFSDIVMAFAAGVMLSASILGLIIPAVEFGGLVTCIFGIFSGAAVLSTLDGLIPHFRNLIGPEEKMHNGNETCNKVLLFSAAIAIHNFPEGLAAGVSFGTGNVVEAMLISGGIALQNVPEGMVTVTPMIACGIPPRKALFFGLASGLVEFIGTLIGYYAVTFVSSILPFALAFAGGTMLYVICDEMIPETHNQDNQHVSTYSLLAGFCMMMASDILLG